MSSVSQPPLRVGRVTLIVHDLDGVGRFYRDVVGLREVRSDPGALALGIGETVLIELRRDPAARPHPRRDAGLFHTAFLLPSRSDLGRWARHAAEHRFAIDGASDHAVSEAIYLTDPEGNGVEIYSDRPAAGWSWSGGLVTLTTAALDVDDLLRSAGTEPWRGAPAGTTIGHVHLQVGAIPAAEQFYAGILGVPVTARYPGGSFFGSGGYHHHLAANIWNSRGAAPKTAPTTGLADVELQFGTDEAVDALKGRLEAAGLHVGREGGGLTIRDPWGTALTIVGPEG